MSRDGEDKCHHGWDGEHYQLRDGDSLAAVHYKNEVNAALDRVAGTGGDMPDTAGEFLANSAVDSYRLFTGPKKVEEACGCSEEASSSNSKK